MNKFKSGDIVVRKVFGRGPKNGFTWSRPFTVHLIGYDNWTQEQDYVLDVFLNKHRIADCEFSDIALSPLYQALSEE